MQSTVEISESKETELLYEQIFQDHQQRQLKEIKEILKKYNLENQFDDQLNDLFQKGLIDRKKLMEDRRRPSPLSFILKILEYWEEKGFCNQDNISRLIEFRFSFLSGLLNYELLRNKDSLVSLNDFFENTKIINFIKKLQIELNDLKKEAQDRAKSTPASDAKTQPPVNNLVEYLKAELKKFIVENKIDEHGRQKLLKGLLHELIPIDDTDLLEVLLAQGADIDDLDGNESIAISLGKQGTPKVAKFLLQKALQQHQSEIKEGKETEFKQAWLSKRGNTKGTGLHFAVATSNVDMVELFVNENVDVQAKEHETLDTPLHNLQDGELAQLDKIVGLILKKNPTCLSITNHTGHTPLLSAISRCKPSAVTVCLKHGASLYPPNSESIPDFLLRNFSQRPEFQPIIYILLFQFPDQLKPEDRQKLRANVNSSIRQKVGKFDLAMCVHLCSDLSNELLPKVYDDHLFQPLHNRIIEILEKCL